MEAHNGYLKRKVNTNCYKYKISMAINFKKDEETK